MNDLQKIGATLQKMRLSQNISQEDLAGITGIDRGYLSGIENGRRRLSMEMYLKICNGLKENPWEILKKALEA